MRVAFGFFFVVQVRDNNFASVTSDHELKQFLVVRNFNPCASGVRGHVTRILKLWLSVARCFAADSSCVTHSRNHNANSRILGYRQSLSKIDKPCLRMVDKLCLHVSAAACNFRS